jgi:N-acetylglutamate synthase-like GNAT family acetyltransferase
MERKSDDRLIRQVRPDEVEVMYDIINDAAVAYRGVIPPDRYHEPYMPMEELVSEMEDGVHFTGCEVDGGLVGVMGVQDRGDVTLIRHAYVRTVLRGGGIGSLLLSTLLDEIDMPVLIGTWADADWAIWFYEKHGFEVVTHEEKERLLRTYWRIPERQVETSVVLADRTWLKQNR